MYFVKTKNLAIIDWQKLDVKSIIGAKRKTTLIMQNDGYFPTYESISGKKWHLEKNHPCQILRNRQVRLFCKISAGCEIQYIKAIIVPKWHDDLMHFKKWVL